TRPSPRQPFPHPGPGRRPGGSRAPAAAARPPAPAGAAELLRTTALRPRRRDGAPRSGAVAQRTASGPLIRAPAELAQSVYAQTGAVGGPVGAVQPLPGKPAA